MARRKKKKVNIKLVILLVAVGVLIVGGVIAYQFRHAFKDPNAIYEQGMAQYEAGNYKAASDFFGEAIYHSSRKQMWDENIRHRLALVRCLEDWLESDAELSAELQRNIFGTIISQLESVTTIDRDNVEAHEKLADFYWGEGRPRERWDRFIAAAEKLAKLTPEDPEVFYRLAKAREGQSAIDPDRFSDALDMYAQACELDPSNVDYYLDWYRALESRQRSNEAEEVLALALEQNPGSAVLHVFDAQSLLRQRRYEQAELAFQRALNTPDKSNKDWLAIGQYYLMSSGNTKQADIDKAAEAFEAARAADPMDWRSYQVLSQVYRSKRDIPRTEAVLRDGLATVEEIRGGQDVEDLSTTDRIAYLSGRLTLSTSLAEVLVGTLPADPEARDAQLDELRQLLAFMNKWNDTVPSTRRIQGTLLLIEGRKAEAQEILSGVFRDAPDPVTARALVQLYLESDQLGEAANLIQYIKGTSQDAGIDEALLLQDAWLQIRFKNLDKAEGLLKQVARMAPDEREKRQLDVLQNMLARERGETAVDVSVPEVITAEQIPALERTARALLASNRTDEALAMLEEMYAQHPDNEGVVASLARLYDQLDRKQDAQALLAKAMEANPDSQRLQYVSEILNAAGEEEKRQIALNYLNQMEEGVGRELALASFYAQTGQGERAIQHLQNAHDAEPDNQAIFDALFNAYLASDPDKAQSLAEKAVPANYDAADGLFYKGRAALAKKSYEEAIRLFQEALEKRFQFSQGHAMLAEAYMLNNQMEQARDSFTVSYNQNPAYAPALIGLARVTEMLGDREEHEKWIDLAYRYAPNNAYVRTRWLQFQAINADPAQVVELAEQRREEFPEDRQNLNLLARAYERMTPPRLEKAAEAYAELYRLSQGTPHAVVSLGLYVDFLVKNNQADEALALIDDAEKTEEDAVGVKVVRATVLLNQGRMDEAEKVIREAIAIDPDDARGYRTLGVLASRADRWELALEAAREMRRLQPENIQLRLIMAEALFRLDRAEEGQAELDAALAERPDDSRPWLMQAQVYRRNNEVEKAVEAFNSAVRIEPRNVSILRMRAEALSALARLDEAEQDLRRAYELQPTPENALALSRYYQNLAQDPVKARTLLQEAVERSPRDVRLWRAVADLQLEARRWSDLEQTLARAERQAAGLADWDLYRAEMWRARGDQQREVETLEGIVQRDKRNYSAIVRLANRKLEMGDYDGVMQFVSTVKEAPQNVVALLRAAVARSLMAKGSSAQAFEQFKQAFRTCAGAEALQVGAQMQAALGAEQYEKVLANWADQEGHWAMRLALADRLMEDGRPNDASELLQKADIASAPPQGQLEVQRWRAVLLNEVGDQEGAVAAYREVLKLNPRDLPALNNIAYVLGDSLGRYDEAIDYARRAVAMAPGESRVLDTLGWLYYLDGQLENAEEILVQSINAEPNSANRYHLGRVYEDLGRSTEAASQYKLGYDLVKSDPSDDFYDELKERVGM